MINDGKFGAVGGVSIGGSAPSEAGKMARQSKPGDVPFGVLSEASELARDVVDMVERIAGGLPPTETKDISLTAGSELEGYIPMLVNASNHATNEIRRAQSALRFLRDTL